jgi:hypothetical protein
MVQNYSELYLAVHQRTAGCPPRRMDRGYWSVFVSPAGGSLDLKK